MRTTILAIGSRGDVEPYIALGLGLQRAGDRVRLATHANFESSIRARGLDYAPIAGDYRAHHESARGRDELARGRGFFPLLDGKNDPDGPFLHRAMADCWRASEDSDR